jgi:hypothetical protein
MGMFGRKQSAVAEPYTPNPDPIFGELNPALTAPMPKKRGLFGNIGKAASLVGDALMYGPFMGVARENIEERRTNNDFRRRLIESEIADEQARRNRPQYQNVSGVGLVRINPDGTTETAVEAGADPSDAPSAVREYEYFAKLPPAAQEQFLKLRQPVPYQFTPQGIEAAGRIAAVREAAKPDKPSAPQYEYRMGPNGQLQRRRIG